MIGCVWPDEFARVDGVQHSSVCQSVLEGELRPTPLPAKLVLNLTGVALGGVCPVGVSLVVLVLVCVSAIVSWVQHFVPMSPFVALLI
jgi:hypothetical protein